MLSSDQNSKVFSTQALYGMAFHNQTPNYKSTDRH